MLMYVQFFKKKHHISNSLIDALRTLDLKYFNHKQQSFTFVIFQVDHPVCHFRIHNAIFVFQISCIHKTNSWWKNVTIVFDVSPLLGIRFYKLYLRSNGFGRLTEILDQILQNAKTWKRVIWRKSEEYRYASIVALLPFLIAPSEKK